MSSVVTSEVQNTLKRVVLPAFLEYAAIDTLADPHAKDLKGCAPSSDRQWDLIHKSAQDLRDIGLDVHVDANGFVYGFLKGNASGDPFTLIAHVDTADAVPVLGVKPRVLAYEGGVISYPDDRELRLDPATSPELLKYIGDTIVTASGKTLLGADDKAGMAEIIGCLRSWMSHPELLRPDIHICFTHDEEIGHGVDGIDLSKLSKYCYTLDGGAPGSIEIETWNAHKMMVSFKGAAAHAGYAKGKMIHSMYAMAEFIQRVQAELPRAEDTENRDGFVHIDAGAGNAEFSTVELIFRDFNEPVNKQRMDQVRQIVKELQAKYPQTEITEQAEFQYPNMKGFIDADPEVARRAVTAIQRTGLELQEHPIRGGTDGSRLSKMGHPCPNLGTGMENIHSRTEWASERAMIESAAVVLNLADEYVQAGKRS